LIEYSPAPEAVFKAVLEGCLKKRRLSFTYYSPATEEKSERTVEPYHLFNYMGTWHTIGYCHLRKEIRDFALSRISEAKVLTESFKIPADFDFKKYFLSTFGLYKGKSTKEVTLRFTPEKSKWIKGQIWHKDQKVKYLKDGSIELSFPVSDFSEIKMEILKHGGMVEVIKPKSLKDLIKAEAKNILKIY
jgi:predicted DNA-binding transcriptional regulator YafY